MREVRKRRRFGRLQKGLQKELTSDLHLNFFRWGNNQPVPTFHRQHRLFVLAFFSEPCFPRDYPIALCGLRYVL
jgi:hypothetical protein